jgi:hypothetical protein
MLKVQIFAMLISAGGIAPLSIAFFSYLEIFQEILLIMAAVALTSVATFIGYKKYRSIKEKLINF